MIQPRRATPLLSDDHRSAASTDADLTLSASMLATPVLIVEDEAVIAWTIETLMEDMGFTDLRIAGDSAQALAAAAEPRPGLVLSDINLGGGVDGIETAARLQEGGPVPVVFISGYAGPDELARIERGTPGAPVLRKPVQLPELRRAVLTTLTSHRPH